MGAMYMQLLIHTGQKVYRIKISPTRTGGVRLHAGIIIIIVTMFDMLCICILKESANKELS